VTKAKHVTEMIARIRQIKSEGLKLKMSRRARVIVCACLVIAVIAVAGAVVVGQHQKLKHDCHDQAQEFTKTTKSLQDSLKKVEPALESTRTARHSSGFTESTKGRNRIKELRDAETKAKQQENVPQPECRTSKQLSASRSVSSQRQASLRSLNTALSSLSDELESYRRDQALTEARTTMANAKTALSSAQSGAQEAMSKAEGTKGLMDDTEARKPYDTVKNQEEATHRLSTDDTASTYDEAVSLKSKADAVQKAADDLVASTKTLNDKVTAYQGALDAKNQQKAQEQPASGDPSDQVPQAQPQNEQHTGGQSVSPSDDTGDPGSRQPAQAPAPRTASGSSSSTTGRQESTGTEQTGTHAEQPSSSSSTIDFGEQPRQRGSGCTYTEGREVCG
jgi:hypothetical protein